MKGTATMSTAPGVPTATLAKGLEVLEALSDVEEIALSELARRLEMAAPTLFRLLATLTLCGYVQKSATGRYRLTLKAWELGAKAVRRIALRDVARPFMERLVAETAETVHLSLLQGDGIVIVEKRDGPQPVRVDTFVGQRAPLHCSASGKAILAFGHAGVLDALPRRRLARFTATTIVERAELDREIAEVRRTGWARNREEWRPGVCAVAVPVCDAAGVGVAALSVTVPTPRFSSAALTERLVPALKRSGLALSQEIAHLHN
jgi:DNA-binding IclR family transcriptional regulator